MHARPPKLESWLNSGHAERNPIKRWSQSSSAVTQMKRTSGCVVLIGADNTLTTEGGLVV